MRNTELDGIRGWAALSVLFFHFFWETFGIIFPFIRTGIFNFIFDGYLAVFIFFILSGDALSNPFFNNNSTFSTVRLVLIRYFRLVFPILLSCVFVYVLMKLNFTYANSAASLVKREDWLGIFITFPASLYKCLKYSLYGVFFYHDTLISYNPFLWTMSIELLGSLIVFINIFVFEHLKKPIIVLGVQLCFFILMESWYSLFILGMIFGYLRSIGVMEKIRNQKYFFWASLFCFLSIVVFDIWYRDPFIQTKFIPNFLMATGLVSSIYCSSALKAIFKWKASVFLGEISFPLYAIHFSVLVSFTSWLILKASHQGWLYSPKALLIPFSSIIVSIILAYIFRQFEKIFLEKMNAFIKKKVIKA